MSGHQWPVEPPDGDYDAVAVFICRRCGEYVVAGREDDTPCPGRKQP